MKQNKIPFYPRVIDWWRDMSDEFKLYKLNYYFPNQYTPKTVSSNIIYVLFLLEKDTGNIDDIYLKEVIYN
jgi:hypothetical protein